MADLLIRVYRQTKTGMYNIPVFIGVLCYVTGTATIQGEFVTGTVRYWNSSITSKPTRTKLKVFTTLFFSFAN